MTLANSIDMTYEERATRVAYILIWFTTLTWGQLRYEAIRRATSEQESMELSGTAAPPPFLSWTWTWPLSWALPSWHWTDQDPCLHPSWSLSFFISTWRPHWAYSFRIFDNSSPSHHWYGHPFSS